MKKFSVGIPLIATVDVTVEAKDESEAIEIVSRMLDRGEVDTDGYDPEPDSQWFVEEE